MKKIKRVLFLMFVLVLCFAGCGQDTGGLDESGELVRAGESAPGFSFVKRDKT